MGLFQRQPISENLRLYTVGVNKTILVVGLGNPGEKYDSTRHNIGFAVIDNFARLNNFPAWASKKDLRCELTIANLGQNRTILCKPQTFMNLSGQAVQAVQQYFGVSNAQTLVVYDELAIPFGQIRTRLGGSDAGHNGVKSLIKHIGEDFGRLRIGISGDKAPKDAAAYVLKKFSKQEQTQLPLILQEASAVITEFIFGDSLAPETRTLI